MQLHLYFAISKLQTTNNCIRDYAIAPAFLQTGEITGAGKECSHPTHIWVLAF